MPAVRLPAVLDDVATYITGRGGYGNAKTKHLEDSGWDLSLPAPNRGTYDQKIASTASECLDFIEGRKHFWALQSKKITMQQL